MVIKNKIMWLIIFLAIYLFIYKYYVYTLINVQDIITRQWYIDLNEYFFLNFRKTDMNFINKYDNKLSMYYNYFTIQTDNEIMTFAIYLKNKFSFFKPATTAAFKKPKYHDGTIIVPSWKLDLEPPLPIS